MDPDVDGGAQAQAQGQLAALRSRLARAEDDGRRASERSAALTELVHALSGADDPQAVAALVATAIPGLLGADSAAVWLWHAREGEMRAVATAGLEPALHDVLLAPLSRATLLGAVTASGRSRPAGTDLHEATLRLQGIADHAATAVHNARLVDSARARGRAEGRPRHVAVNSSVRTLLDPRVVEGVRSRLRHRLLDPEPAAGAARRPHRGRPQHRAGHHGARAASLLRGR